MTSRRDQSFSILPNRSRDGRFDATSSRPSLPVRYPLSALHLCTRGTLAFDQSRPRLQSVRSASLGHGFSTQRSDVRYITSLLTLLIALSGYGPKAPPYPNIRESSPCDPCRPITSFRYSPLPPAAIMLCWSERSKECCDGSESVRRNIKFGAGGLVFLPGVQGKPHKFIHRNPLDDLEPVLVTYSAAASTQFNEPHERVPTSSRSGKSD
jgi:hypothetical protein